MISRQLEVITLLMGSFRGSLHIIEIVAYFRRGLPMKSGTLLPPKNTSSAGGIMSVREGSKQNADWNLWCISDRDSL